MKPFEFTYTHTEFNDNATLNTAHFKVKAGWNEDGNSDILSIEYPALPGIDVYDVVHDSNVSLISDMIDFTTKFGDDLFSVAKDEADIAAYDEEIELENSYTNL